MQVRILQVLGKTLRFRDQDLHEHGSRSIDDALLKKLLDFSETAYRVIPDPTGDHLKTLVAEGKRLFQWLDGPEQWVSGLPRADVTALHIDVTSNLRHLPWELLCDGMFLCGNPNRLFTPVYRVGLEERTGTTRQPPSPAVEPQNRPLRVLFMASSPEAVKPVLDFEAEESMILENTRKQPIELEVEESGCLEWLGQRIADHPAGAFDVVHITGHATQTDKGPRFILEDDVGLPQWADAREITDAFGGRFPRLLFLSGCETAKAGKAGAMPSLAEELVRAGCPAVLGWALPVGDVHASVTGAFLYEHLAIGDSLARSVAAARQKLLEAGSPHWHLLRLYADDTPLEPLVTPKNTPGRIRVSVRPAQLEFLDTGRTIEVCARDEFVGRRRLLQKGLRCLRAEQGTENYAEGLLLTGMGGLGKSSLAARLAERLPQFRRVVVVGAMDEPAFRAEVRSRIPDKAVRDAMESDAPLNFWLRDILDGLEGPVLFIFDDFEKNRHGDPSDDFRPTPAAAHILNVLARTIRDTASPCRILVTCRFRFSLVTPCRLAELPLLTMQDSELLKKLRLLQAALSKRIAGLRDRAVAEALSKRREELEDRAVQAAAGNPRLLDRLYKLLGAEDANLDTILAQMEQVEAEFREDVLLDRLIASRTSLVCRLLATVLLVGIPVHPDELRGILPEAGPDDLNQATEVGLLEHFRHTEANQWYYASPLLTPYLEGTLGNEEVSSLSGLAARALYGTRWEGDGLFDEEIGLAIHRLAMAGSENAIAVDMAVLLSRRWINRSNYRLARALCELTLEQVEDYRILHSLACAEEALGDTSLALAHYEQALALCPPAIPASPEEELRERAAILHNLAGLYLTHGMPAKAMELWKQSIEIDEQIGNVQGKAATLHAMAGVLAQQGEIPKAMELWKQSLEIKEQIGDVQGKAATLHAMAGVLAQQGEIPKAMELWKQSIEIDEQIGNVQGKAATLHAMAVFLAQQGEIPQAMELWKQSLDIKEQIGNVKGKAATLHEMAVFLAQQGEIPKAMELWKQSLEIEEQIGNVKGKAATLHAMAGVLAQQGEIPQAMELWQQSLEIEEQIGNVKGKAATLHAMAGVLAQQGEIPQAMELWQQSIEIDEQIGDVQGKAATLHAMAGVLAQEGEIPKAMELWKQSLEIEEQIGDVQGKAATLHNMAGVLAQQGEIPKAMELWKQSLDIKEQIGNVKGKAATLHEMAVFLAQQGEIPKAMELWKQSLEIEEQIGNVKGKAATLHAMAGVLAQQGEIPQAMELWQQSIEIDEQIGDVQGKAATLHAMAGVLAQEGEIPKAMELWKQSLEIEEQIGDVQGKAATLHNMAGVLAQQGEIPKAMELWKQSLEIEEQIGNVQGKAATLAYIAWAAWKQGDSDEAERLNRQAAELLGSMGAWPDLTQVLGNMGGVYAQQGLWLGLRVHVPAELLLGLGFSVFQEWPPESDSAPWLAAALVGLVMYRYENHPKNEEFLERAFSLLGACAEVRGIAEESFRGWMEAERLNDPNFFMPALDKALRESIPDDAWLFDPGEVS